MEDELSKVDLLSCDPLVLAKNYNVSITVIHRKVQELKASLTYESYPVTSLQTGNEAFDNFAQLKTGYIYEITGESSSGKSNLLIYLALHLQPSLLLSTEKLSNRRLHDMSAASGVDTSRVFVRETTDFEDLSHVMKYQVPLQVERKGIKTVLIDSITSNFRGHEASLQQRSKDLAELVSTARQLFTMDVAILFTNQVSDRFNHPKDIASLDGQLRFLGSRSKAPALGLVWVNLIDTRIMLGRRRGGTRWMKVLKCPWVAEKSVDFEIQSHGFAIVEKEIDGESDGGSDSEVNSEQM